MNRREFLSTSAAVPIAVAGQRVIPVGPETLDFPGARYTDAYGPERRIEWFTGVAFVSNGDGSFGAFAASHTSLPDSGVRETFLSAGYDFHLEPVEQEVLCTSSPSVGGREFTYGALRVMIYPVHPKAQAKFTLLALQHDSWWDIRRVKIYQWEDSWVIRMEAKGNGA